MRAIVLLDHDYSHTVYAQDGMGREGETHILHWSGATAGPVVEE